MPGWVGTAAPRWYPGVVTAVAAPMLTVRCADDDGDGQPLEFVVRGTASVADRVTVLVPPVGRPTLVRS